MSPIYKILNEIFEQIVQKNELSVPLRTTADLAAVLKVSPPHLSRIKNGKSSVGEEVMLKAFAQIDNLEKDVERRGIWKAKLREAAESTKDSESDSVKIDAPKIPRALNAWHNRFFLTREGDDPSQRLICMLYNEMPQSRQEGNNPEYLIESLEETKKGLACAMFQPFGSVMAITEKMLEAAENNQEVEAWGYILALATAVHKIYGRTREVLQADPDNKGQVVLLEASEVPSLSVCNLHSRLFYSEKQTGMDKVHIVQMVMGRDVNTEHYIECGSEPSFKSVIASQFYPVLPYWRENKRLPTKQGEIDDLHRRMTGEEKNSPWTLAK